MNEAAQVLKQTNRERKVAGYGAHHKKGGSAVSKLGNKPMSWQEIQSKHGPVQTYTEGFTTYEEFKKMPPDLEAEYVNKLCSKYAIRMEHISEILFEAGPTDLMSRLKIIGVYKQCPQLKTTAVTNNAIEKFKADVSEWREREASAKIIDLSEAQRKRNVIEHSEFISYEEYKTFNDSEKVEYINSLVDRYDVGRSVISRSLFNKSSHTLDAYFKTKNLSSMLHTAKPCAPQIRQEKTKVFENAIKAWKGESVVKEKTETAVEPVKEEPEAVARDILAAIIGEEPEKPSNIIAKILQVDKVEKPAEVTVEEPKKDDLPESNISAVYIPVTREEFDDSVEKMPKEPLETVTDVESFVEQPDNPKAASKPSSEVHFSTRYISEKGLDRETIMNKIYLLASLFENEENLEITLTVATKKEA